MQVLVDCVKGGCSGGDPNDAYSYILEHGIPDETCSNYEVHTRVWVNIPLLFPSLQTLHVCADVKMLSVFWSLSRNAACCVVCQAERLGLAMLLHVCDLG